MQYYIVLHSINIHLDINSIKALIPKAGAEVHRQVLVPFLKSFVFAHVVQVVASDHNRPLHLHLQHNPGQNPPSDRHVTSERALLINVVSLCRLGVANMHAI